MLWSRACWLVVIASAGCSSSNAPTPQAKPAAAGSGSRALDAASAKPSFAIVHIVRTVVYDDHTAAGGKPPDIDAAGQHVALDFGKRPPGSLPIVRSYAIEIAVPSDRPRTWNLHLGEDYDLLIVTRGFTSDATGVKLDGRVKSNYQVMLGDNGWQGPNGFGFGAAAIGAPSAVQVMNDESRTAIYRELEEWTIEQVTPTPSPALLAQGIDEHASDQAERWDAWKPIRKTTLR